MAEWLPAVAVFLLLGAFAGLSAGLFGIGGGLLVVPALSWLLPRLGVSPELAMHLAVGSSLATIAFTGVSAVLAHHRRGALRLDLFRALLPGVVLGALAGAALADALPAAGLKRLFGLFELGIGVWLALAPTVRAAKRAGRWLLPAGGGVIGLVSALLGIGGGTLTVPLLLRLGVRTQEAVATASACGLPIALAGAAGFLVAGLDRPDLPPGSTGWLWWPAIAGIVAGSLPAAPRGARLAHALSSARLRRLFGVVVMLLGAAMLLR